MMQWFENADYVAPRVTSMLMNFYVSNLPATKPMLPKLLTLLQHCHDFSQTSNGWYIYLQEIIQNHYKTEGNCLFYDDSKEILSGEVDLLEEELSKTIDGLKLLTVG
jgi:hypothetical protein